VSTADYITYTLLFTTILATQLGRRTPTLHRLILPVLIVAGIGLQYLTNLPAGTASHLIEAAGIAAGLLFGLASTALVRVDKDPGTGRAVTTAGFAYAAVWTTALAARLAFAYGSTHWFHTALTHFTTANHINPATYATFFVLMVLTMITVRTISVIHRAHHQHADLNTRESRIARHLLHA
jgi:drug/metabolite transporter (DMT)-like permease